MVDEEGAHLLAEAAEAFHQPVDAIFGQPEDRVGSPLDRCRATDSPTVSFMAAPRSLWRSTPDHLRVFRLLALVGARDELSMADLAHPGGQPVDRHAPVRDAGGEGPRERHPAPEDRRTMRASLTWALVWTGRRQDGDAVR